MLFKEYINKVKKNIRKSGPLRKMGIKTILGNPKLSLPLTGDENADTQRRYKNNGGKFNIPKHVKKIRKNNPLL